MSRIPHRPDKVSGRFQFHGMRMCWRPQHVVWNHPQIVLNFTKMGDGGDTTVDWMSEANYGEVDEERPMSIDSYHLPETTSHCGRIDIRRWSLRSILCTLGLVPDCRQSYANDWASRTTYLAINLSDIMLEEKVVSPAAQSFRTSSDSAQWR
ncbi:unnamed protein product [Mesocestoides corti]|uniref:DDE_Tnp_1_7 domain-containing protein n=1 Tax=Mesocestoides corti TaxID=53468 RepID=A0A0R3UQQ8_MESCO|nr:unnamed protein product [Mesocestoides corti]